MSKKYFTISLVAIGLAATIASATIVQAGVFDAINQGFGTAGEAAGYPTDNGKPKTEFNVAWLYYLNGFATIMGLLFMILVIYGGWLWMTARGNDEQVNKAKSLMIQATTGLAIVIAGRIIAEIVINLLGNTIQTS